VTIGKGFAGVMKRHNFAGGRKTHGASLVHRTPVRSASARPGPCVSGQAHVGSHGRDPPHHREPEGRERGQRAQPAADRGAIPGAEGGDVVVRASVKALRRAARKTVQPHKKS